MKTRNLPCSPTPRTRSTSDVISVPGYGLTSTMRFLKVDGDWPTPGSIRAKHGESPYAVDFDIDGDSSTIHDMRMDFSALSKKERDACYKENSKYRFKAVVHDKWTHQFLSGSAILAVVDNEAWNPASAYYNFAYDLSEGVGMFEGMKNPLHNHPDSIKHVVTSKEILEGLVRLRPDNSDDLGGFPLVEFLTELKELRRLTDLPNLLKKMGDVVGKAADLFVGTNFGLLPFTSDVKAAVSMMQKIDDFLDRWNDLADKGKTMNFHTTLFDFSGTSIKTTPDVIISSLLKSTYTTEVVSTNVAKLHVYLVPQRISKSDRIFQKFISLGLDKPLSTAWELTPFSWLVDYFLNIQKWIGNFEGADSPFKYQVVDAGYSYLVKDTAYRTATLEWRTAQNVKLEYRLQGSPPAVLEEKSHYDRQPLDPTWVGEVMHTVHPYVELVASGPSPHQSLLAAGVGIGMRRN